MNNELTVDKLYGRGKEIKQIAKAIKEKKPLIIITGPRGSGKTSLLYVVLRRHRDFPIYLDLQKYFSVFIKREQILNSLEKEIQKQINSLKDPNLLIKRLSKVKGISFNGKMINFEKNSRYPDLIELFSELDKYSADKKIQIIFAVDEAHRLKNCQHLDFSGIFAYLYDNCKNLTIILVDQKMALLDQFLEIANPKSPLFGRVFLNIDLGKLSKKEEKIILNQYFRNFKRKISESESKIISKALSELPPLYSYLHLFALNSLRMGKITDQVLNITLKESENQAKNQFDQFLQNRLGAKKYLTIIEALSQGSSSWKKIKDYVELQLSEKLYDKNFNSLLENLMSGGFVIKEGDKYKIFDPSLERALLKKEKDS